MNTPKPDYLGEAEIIDAGEFARLIREHRGLTLYVIVRSSSLQRDVPGVLGCVSVKLSAKQALAELNSGSLDGFAWQYARNYGPHVDTTPACELLQLRRVLPRLPAKIAEYERLAAGYTHPEQARCAETYRGFADRARRQLAEVEARLATLSAPAAAASAA
jgi:hypothetical protein